MKKKYFNNIGDKINLYKELKKIIDSLLVNKIVLDIGSGGHLFYDYSLAKKIIILDLSKTMLDESSNKEIVKVYQDARNMTKIKDKSVDIILIIFALHHINGKSYKESVISIDFLEDKKYSNISQLNKNIPSKSISNTLNNNDSFDLQTYEKFLSFLKFQEMINRYEQ